MNFLFHKIENTFIRGISWLGLSQISVRIARLASTIVVARLLAPEHFGIAAIVLTINEVSHVVAKSGTSSRVVNAADHELVSVCQSANSLNWSIGGVLFVFQCLLAIPLANFYGNESLIWPLCCLAFTYLLLPLAMVHSALNIRQERMDIVARTEMTQAVVDAGFTIVLAIAGFGIWALILPKLLVVPIWVVLHRRHCNWIPDLRINWSHSTEVMSFTKRVVGVELLGVFRHNIDYILIGYFLGLPALGIYFFAYNAGLGISRGFITVLNNALYPHLCGARGNFRKLQQRFDFGIRLNLLIISPIIALQALLAPTYIPLIFGERWVDLGAVPLVVLICLAGIPLALTEIFSQLLRAMGDTSRDLRWHTRFSLVFFAVVLASLHWGLVGVALATLILQYISTAIHYLLNVKSRIKTQQLLSESSTVQVEQ